MSFVKNNKVFLFLFLSYSIIILTLSYMLIKGEDTVFNAWGSSNNYTENNIAYFNGNFNDERKAIEFNWNVELAKGAIEKFEIFREENLLREGINASSAVLSIYEYDIPTGNNKFDLCVTLTDGTLMKKTVYVYIDEVFDFEVSENIVGMSILYDVTYTYDDRNPVTPPQFSIYNIDQLITLNYISAKEISSNNHYKTIEAVYELNYENIETGRYEINVNWEFIKYNLSFPDTSIIDVQE